MLPKIQALGKCKTKFLRFVWEYAFVCLRFNNLEVCVCIYVNALFLKVWQCVYKYSNVYVRMTRISLLRACECN